ncbi:MAG: hypothetical protein V4787_27235, partial [Pseudomonadota bacterium]
HGYESAQCARNEPRGTSTSSKNVFEPQQSEGELFFGAAQSPGAGDSAGGAQAPEPNAVARAAARPRAALPPGSFECAMAP